MQIRTPYSFPRRKLLKECFDFVRSLFHQKKVSSLTFYGRAGSPLHWTSRGTNGSQSVSIFAYPLRACRARPYNAHGVGVVFLMSIKKETPQRLFFILSYSTILETTPEATVRPPSRIAKRKPSSIATGVMSSTLKVALSPGITISTPSCKVMSPVTSVVLK